MDRRFEQAWRFALGLPGVEEGTSYGTPALRVSGRLFARVHQSGEALVVHTTLEERERSIEADPEVLYVTDHYLNYPWVLVRLSAASAAQLRHALEQAWRLAAPESRKPRAGARKKSRR